MGRCQLAVDIDNRELAPRIGEFVAAALASALGGALPAARLQ